MNILLIDYALPSSVFSGKTIRLKNIYGKLAEKHRVIYLRVTQPGQEKESEELEIWVQKTFARVERLPKLSSSKFFNRVKTMALLRPWYDLFMKYPDQVEQVSEKLNGLADEESVDAVVTFSIEAAQYGLLLSKRLPWIQDLGDSMILQLRRRYKHASWRSQADYYVREMRESGFENEMIQRAQSTIFVAKDDADLYASEKSKICVIPNGVDVDYFDSKKVNPISSLNPYVVFTGHMSFPPNQDAAIYFAREILPLIRRVIPNMEFKVVGADPSDAVKQLGQIPGVEVTGRVSDLRPYLAGAAVFVCPMRMGSGIKNKVLEAMSMNLPVVATSLAVKGIQIVQDAWTITQVDSPAEFAQAIIQKYQKSGEISKNAGAREFVNTYYSWSQTLRAYESLLAPSAKRVTV